MNAIPMSRAASALLRAILDRAGVERNRILLRNIQSHDWQSLTLAGERHTIQLRVAGPDAEIVANALTSGIEDAEFSIPGQIVADIAAAAPVRTADGSLTLSIDALTITE